MTTKTNLKAGGWSNNHNETLVRDSRTGTLKLKTHVRAGARSTVFKITFSQQS